MPNSIIDRSEIEAENRWRSVSVTKSWLGMTIDSRKIDRSTNTTPRDRTSTNRRGWFMLSTSAVMINSEQNPPTTQITDRSVRSIAWLLAGQGRFCAMVNFYV